MALRRRPTRPDDVAAWAVATGVGLITLMIAWSVANRATTIAWGAPVGSTVALIGAVVLGGLVGSLTGRRLARSLRAGDVRAADHLLKRVPSGRSLPARTHHDHGPG